MKKLLIILLLISATAQAADLTWDYDAAQNSITKGYTVYFSDGTNQYNKSFLKEETVVDGAAQKVTEIESKLNLKHGTQYSFSLTRYNDSGVSDPSNTALWTRLGYVPPADVLPVAPTGSPNQTINLKVE
jgi:hypothetical protein